ncbi:MAG: nucleotide sugar dehydrogenase, partial [Planctomycetota bacterium]
MSSSSAELIQRIESRDATVAVVGLGYVGLPLLAVVADAGFRAVGFDADPAKIEMLKAGKTYLPHLPPSVVDSIVTARERITLSANAEVLGGSDAVLLCVPTPLDENRIPDLNYVGQAARDVGKHCAGRSPAELLVVLESSTYPGTTRDIVASAVAEESKHETAKVLYAYSPEREDPGNPDFTTRTIPKLVGGLDEASTDAA